MISRWISRDELGLFVARLPQAEARRQDAALQLGVGAQLDVVEDAHAMEERDVLEGPRHAAIGALARLERRDILAVERHAAVLGFVEARYDVEQARLAGAVRADDGGDPARLGVNADAAQGLQAAECKLDVIDPQHGQLRRAAACPRMVDRDPVAFMPNSPKVPCRSLPSGVDFKNSNTCSKTCHQRLCAHLTHPLRA